MAAPPPPPRGGLSLYDDINDPNEPASSATISSAPVKYDQNDSSSNPSASAKKPINPAFQFQPIRRPQPRQPPKAPSFPKAVPKAPVPAAAATAVASTPIAVPKSTLADWAATEDDEWFYGTGEKRQRGGRRNKKKREQYQDLQTDWDDIYDPARPTNVEEYLKSDEKIDEVRQWKALLHRHRKSQVESDLSDDSADDSRPTNQFAPPPSYGFVPPPPPSPPRAAPPPPDDATGDDAYARRLAMSQQQQVPPPPAPPPPPTEEQSATISRAPIRYTQEEQPPSPPPVLNDEASDPDAPRSSRPGQAGFAQRLMSKYGWSKGTGLGASETGIINPLQVQVEKRKKKSDAEGGGWAEPANKAKIVGGKRKNEDTGKFGIMSEVIVLQNMLENMPDLQAEIANGLGQEIGEECGEKYGRVERLYIDHDSRRVFIKFINQVSALRAVNELEGRVFNGNTIVPKFYNTEDFEGGSYANS